MSCYLGRREFFRVIGSPYLATGSYEPLQQPCQAILGNHHHGGQGSDSGPENPGQGETLIPPISEKACYRQLGFPGDKEGGSDRAT